MNNHVNIKLTNEQVKYLEKRARKKGILKKNGEPSLGRTVKEIVEHARFPGQPNKASAREIERLELLLEQVNVMIPQLLYYAMFQAGAESTRLDDDKYQNLIRATLDKMGQVCGQFQGQKYEHVFVGQDNKNMKTLPVNDEDNQWK